VEGWRGKEVRMVVGADKEVEGKGGKGREREWACQRDVKECRRSLANDVFSTAEKEGK
jgi:hypothetical protein